VVDILISGGPVMIPLGLLSMVAAAIIMERLWVLRRSNFLQPSTVQTLSGLLASDKFQGSIDFCRRHPGPFTGVVVASPGAGQGGDAHDAAACKPAFAGAAGGGCAGVQLQSLTVSESFRSASRVTAKIRAGRRSRCRCLPGCAQSRLPAAAETGCPNFVAVIAGGNRYRRA